MQNNPLCAVPPGTECGLKNIAYLTARRGVYVHPFSTDITSLTGCHGTSVIAGCYGTGVIAGCYGAGVIAGLTRNLLKQSNIELLNQI